MKRICLYLLLLFSTPLFGQVNLVMNPSFEDTISCQQWNNSWPLLPCVPWYQSYGSPDLFTSIYTPWCGSTPQSSCVFGCQTPRTGYNYAGFTASGYPYVNDFRESIAARLNDTLVSNHRYYVQFYVSAGDNCHIHVDKIGAYFSVDSIDPDANVIYSYTPQIENATGNIINDTINWTQISGYFIAQGGEKWIMIGNFKDDAHTMFDSISNWVNVEAFYYLDDVSVIDCTATGINETTINSLLQLTPNPASHYFTVKVQQNLLLEKVSVYSLVGEKVMEQNASGNAGQLTVNVAALPKGIYLVKIKTNKGVGYKKLVLQ